MIESRVHAVGRDVVAGYYDPHEDKFKAVTEPSCNMNPYQGFDAIGRILSGDPDYFISYLYFEFTNGSVPNVTPALSEGQDYYAGLAGDSEKDIIRVPITSTPTLDASGENYNTNKVTFFGATSGITGHFGRTFSAAAGSTVYGAALVAAPTNSFADDLVVGRFYFATNLPKQTNTQIGIQWSMIVQN